MARSKKTRGFSLLELMIVVAIIAIIAAVALPSYREHVKRGQTQEAIAQLADARVRLEHFFQDNRSYAAADCDTITPNRQYFNYVCVLNAADYTLTANGKAAAGMAGYQYTITETNARTSTIPVPSGGSYTVNCWVTKRGEMC